VGSLGSLESMEAVLIANLSPLALTTCIANGQDLLLYRTLDLPDDPELRLQEVQRGVAVASAYYEDKLGVSPRRLHYAGSYKSEYEGVTQSGAEAFGLWLDDPELTVVDLAPQPESGALTALGQASIAGVVGALAGAR